MSALIRLARLGPAAAVAAREDLRLQIVKRPPQVQGFTLLPKRWVTELTFAWLGRNRRLANNYEMLIETSIAMFVTATVQLLVRRLAAS